MSGIEIVLGTLYIAGSIRGVITTVKEARNFSRWVKKKKMEKEMKKEEWNFIEVCNDEFVLIEKENNNENE